MDRARRFLFLAGALTSFTTGSFAQVAPGWRVYRVADGLAASACSSVTISSQGKVITKHPNVRAISEFDGYRIKVFPMPEVPTGRVYESPAGQLWTASENGLQEFRGGVWLIHPAPEIASVFRNGSSSSLDPVPLC